MFQTQSVYLYSTNFPCILLTRHQHILKFSILYFQSNLFTSSMPGLIYMKDTILDEEIKYWKSRFQVFASVGDVEWIFKRDSRINESPPEKKGSLSISPLCCPKRVGLTVVQNTRCKVRLRRWKLRLISEAWSKNWWHEDAFDVSNVKHDDVRRDKWRAGRAVNSLLL
jgi:hypothetical protein